MVLRLDELLAHHKDQGRLHPHDVGEVRKDTDGNQVQLLRVGVPCALAGFVVYRVRNASLVVDDEQVGDTTPPTIRVVEPAGGQVFPQPHLVLAVLLTGDGVEFIERRLDVSKLERQWFAIPNVLLGGGVHRASIHRSLCWGLDYILGYLSVVVLFRTLLECFEAAERPCYFGHLFLSCL